MRDWQWIEAQRVDDCRRHVDVLRQIPHNAGLNSAGIAHDQRHAQSGLIPAVLLEPAMLTETVAVIRHVDDEGVLVEAQAAEGIEHATDIPIEKSNRGVIRGDYPAFIVVTQIAKDFGDLPSVLGPDTRHGK